ncbi:hypothetical protein RQP46_010937 [Phenoliferia psychrophenolica]
MSSPTSLPTSTRVWLLSDPPQHEVTASTFSLSTQPIPSPLPPSSILVQVLYFSNDPAQRGWIQKDADAARLYVPPVRKGDKMRSGGLGRVVASTSDLWKVGALVTGQPGWTEFVVLGEKEVQPVPEGLESPTIALSLLGGTGLTAYFGLVEVGLIKEGKTSEKTVVISGAAGSTGSTAVQLAKHVFGVKRVVGIAGGADKCAYVKSLGADVCVDYKSPTFEQDLIDATPDYAEIYFDNVGGSVLNAMLPRVKRWGRVIACGAIAAYNDVSQSVLPNWFEVISNRITVQGFLVFDFPAKVPEAKQVLAAALKAGHLKLGNHETVREVPFEKIPEVWQTLFVGANTGKLITKLAGAGKL